MIHRRHDEDETQDHPPLPEGEPVLWQGSPALWPLARDAFHVRKLAVYFVILLGWSIASGVADGLSTMALAEAAARVLLLASLGLGLVMFLAWRSVRATTYIVTPKRVVLRIGMALPMTVNLPLASIQGVSLRLDRDGSGDVAIALPKGQRLAWLHLWPHARPWQVRNPEPAFRSIPDAQAAAGVLAAALDPNGQATAQAVRAPSASDRSQGAFAPALSSR